MALHVGVDLAGADVSEEALYQASMQVRGKNLLVQFYSTKSFSPSCILCSQTITMEEEPSCFRKKKDSTLVRGLQDLAEGKIASLVTCANTGAVVSAASVYLGRFVAHPALAAILPSKKGMVVLLDAGALLVASSEDLVIYAVLGSTLASSFLQGTLPKVGILNVGKERKKGTDELKRADAILSSKKGSFLYRGFVEPIDVFSGEVDVLVTSGFTGNIFLKTTEGVATTLCSFTEKQSYGGAFLVGVKHPLIKCHGKPTMESFQHALLQAHESASSGLVQRLEDAFSDYSKGL